jgi:hypothetical protein
MNAETPRRREDNAKTKTRRREESQGKKSKMRTHRPLGCASLEGTEDTEENQNQSEF